MKKVLLMMALAAMTFSAQVQAWSSFNDPEISMAVAAIEGKRVDKEVMMVMFFPADECLPSLFIGAEGDFTESEVKDFNDAEHVVKARVDKGKQFTLDAFLETSEKEGIFLMELPAENQLIDAMKTGNKLRLKLPNGTITKVDLAGSAAAINKAYSNCQVIQKQHDDDAAYFD